MLTLGISAFYHNSSCCLFQDGVLLSAIQEERLSRIKSDAAFPIKSIRTLLEAHHVSIHDIDLVCYYEDPKLKFERQFSQISDSDISTLARAKEKYLLVEKSIRENLSYQGEIFFSKHHQSHLGNGIFQSGWKEASFLTVDGVGEWNTITWGNYSEKGIEVSGHIDFPHSLGLFYSTMTSFLGFDVNDEEFKVMGLSAFGKPRFKDILSRELFVSHGMNLKLNLDYFKFPTDNQEVMFTAKLEELLGMKKRNKHDAVLDDHKDLARSAQEILEDELRSILTSAFPSGCKKLILSGGVAYNSLANNKISELSGFESVFIPAAANDSGSSIGACIVAHFEKNKEFLFQKDRVPYWGTFPGTIEKLGDIKKYFKPLMVDDLLKHIFEGKIIALCRGNYEFGDRALGNRSIIAHPDYPEIKDILNSKVKRREEFRPFAPVVVYEKASHYFEMREENTTMSKVYRVKPEYHERLAGIQNVDHTARVQTLKKEDNPFLYDLLLGFERISGLPMLINTSFNLNGEPIVASAENALHTFLKTNIDVLVIENQVLLKEELPQAYVDLYRSVTHDVKNYNPHSAYDFI